MRPNRKFASGYRETTMPSVMRRLVEGVKERGLIGADNPVARGDVKREETGKRETREQGRERKRKRIGDGEE